MGSFPHELPGYRHIGGAEVREQFDKAWGVTLQPEPGLRIPNMFDAAQDGSFKGLYCQGEDIVQSDPDTQHVADSLKAMECIVVQDIFLNETAKYATCSCRAPRSSRRTAPSPTPSAASRGCAR
jgi:formate dehydrogenase major subunit